MASTSDQIVQHRRPEFQALVAYVMSPEPPVQTASTVEVTLFRRRLAAGATLLRLVLVTCAAVRPSGTVTGSAGTAMTSHDQRPTTDESVFGKVRGGLYERAANGCEPCGELSVVHGQRPISPPETFPTRPSKVWHPRLESILPRAQLCV